VSSGVVPDGRGLFGGAAKVTAQERVADFARVQVRAGLLDPVRLQAEVEAAVAAERPDVDAAATARALVDRARSDLVAEQAGWDTPTDHERLQHAFATLEAQQVLVLQAVEDHWVADAALRARAADGAPAAGAVWFTAADVWHAVDHGMLELNVWHADTANVAPGEPLLGLVVDALAEVGLEAHFDEGRVEAAVSWRKPARP